MSTVTRKPGRSPGAIIKTILVGRTRPSWQLAHTTLPKILALPILSSDPLSSVAYATEQIMLVLMAASAGSIGKVMPIATAIAILLVIVIASYVQVVKGYPSGGGAYVVAKDNLGTLPALIGAAALLVDYVMTVAVSVVGGVVAIVSFSPSLAGLRVEMSIAFVILLTLANLRGVREAGLTFAAPTYLFVVSIMAMLAVGLLRCTTGACPQTAPIEPLAGLARTAGPIGLFVILHAFSSGATALTGVEAISNAVPIFRRPQGKNAQRTMIVMGSISVTMFVGVSYLASRMHPTVNETRSVVAQIAEAVFNGGPGFFLVQLFTTLILVLAANTSYQGFPRLSAILAQDSFLPRQFRNIGDRLVYSNGIVVLSLVSIALIVAFDANLDKLIQLYIVGVFTAFTLSQVGMVQHWLKERRRGSEAQRGWRTSIVINAVGGVCTALVLAVTVTTKFVHGAWIAMAGMVVIVFNLLMINRHYTAIGRQLRRMSLPVGTEVSNHVVLLVPDAGPAVAEALGWIRSFRPADVRAVEYPRGKPDPELRRKWTALSRASGPDLEPLPPGPGDQFDRLKAYIRTIPRAEFDFVTVVVPELVDRPGIGYLLGRRDLIRLKGGLLREPRVVVTDVPVQLEGGLPLGVDGRALIPTRTVAMVFVSAVHDGVTRAVNYARSLAATETRAVFFAFEPKDAPAIQEEWGARGYGIPLDVVEAPFRDLRAPMLEEVRRYTAREDTVATVVMPEIVVKKWRHLLLHNQTPLFVKRLLLFEPRVVLTSVPYAVE
ncbi:MAG TPA: APC family permease [Actinomycetota bacterium]